jgi:hypothetical protein
MNRAAANENVHRWGKRKLKRVIGVCIANHLQRCRSGFKPVGARPGSDQVGIESQQLDLKLSQASSFYRRDQQHALLTTVTD